MANRCDAEGTHVALPSAGEYASDHPAAHDHVIEFVRRSAGLLSGGEIGQDQWQRMNSEFDYLHRLLKAQGEDLDEDGEETSKTSSANGAAEQEQESDDDDEDSIGQDEIDALFG